MVFTHIAGTAVIRALGPMGVPVVALHYSSNEMGYLSRYVRQRLRVPDPKQNELAFLERLMDLGTEFAGSLLIPTDDYTLVALSRYKKPLQTKYIVAAEDWTIVSQCINKQHTYARASAIGIPCPVGFLVRSPRDLEQCQHTIGFPCVMKPCQGHGFYEVFGVKMFKITNAEELLEQYEKASVAGTEVMVQELIPGGDAEGVNYNSYFVDGRPIAEFTARKVRLEPPFFGSPRAVVSRRVPEIIEPGRALLQDLKYSGFSCTEFKRDVRDGQYKLMEINCRNNRSGSLAVACGMNFPWIMYKHLVYGDILAHAGFRENVAWIEGTSDLMRFFVSRKAERYSLREYLKPYRLEKVFAVLSIKDPFPFVQRCWYLVRLVGKNLRARLPGRKQIAKPHHSSSIG